MKKPGRKGYVVKMHKRFISSANYLPYPTEGNQHFNFISWMNFDGIQIQEIDNFTKFRSFTLGHRPTEVDIFTERQKILLYELTDLPEENIFSNSGKYAECPLIVITLINLSPTDKSPNSDEKLRNFLAARNKTFFYELMGTLSSSDYAVIFRGNNYEDIFKTIHKLRKTFTPEYTYSISGFDPSNIDNWNANADFTVSIRVMLPSGMSPQNLRTIIENTNTLKEVQLFHTFGKFDAEVRGTLLDPIQFAKLYSKNVLDAFFEHNSYGFLSSNTRLLCLESSLDSDLKEYNRKLEEYYEKDYPEVTELREEQLDLINKFAKVSTSQILVASLLQLIMRKGQAELSIHTKNTCDDVLTVINQFMVLTLESLSETGEGSIPDISEGLASLNTLLDNRIFVSYRAFEAPIANVQFTGASSKLLSAFTNFVEQVLKFVRPVGVDTVTYIPYLTIVNAQTRIITSLLFNELPVSLVNVSIPIDMLFDIKSSFCLLLHEIGHLDCFSCDRDIYIKEVIANILLNVASKYMTRHPDENDDTFQARIETWVDRINQRRGFPMQNLTDKLKHQTHRNSTLTYAEIKKVVIPYVLSLLSQCASDFVASSQQPYEVALAAQDIVEETFDLYLEGIADAFMCEILQLTNVAFYIKLFANYFELANADFSSLQSNIILRIVCVGLLIESAKSGETEVEKLKEMLLGEVNSLSSEEGKLGDLCKQIGRLLASNPNDSAATYPAICLFRYLQESVILNIQRSIQQPKAMSVVEKIRYFANRFVENQDEFLDSIEFMETFNNK